MFLLLFTSLLENKKLVVESRTPSGSAPDHRYIVPRICVNPHGTHVLSHDFSFKTYGGEAWHQGFAILLNYSLRYHFIRVSFSWTGVSWAGAWSPASRRKTTTEKINLRISTWDVPARNTQFQCQLIKSNLRLWFFKTFIYIGWINSLNAHKAYLGLMSAPKMLSLAHYTGRMSSLNED
jgi:hypothetical protein